MIERIRTQMIKHPLHELWNKSRNKWSDKDRADFNELEKGVIEVKEKQKPNRIYTTTKVLRTSDGMIFNSVTECIKLNGFHTVEMQRLLNENIEFKRI